MDVAPEADHISEPDCTEKREQLLIAEAAIGQNGCESAPKRGSGAKLVHLMAI
jgi:hypothetical protein